MISFC